jgi:hypothetical protein
LDEIALILATSRPGGKSFVKDLNGKIIRKPNDPWKNEVCLVGLSLMVGRIGPA